eukprot:scaffold15375_cov26-Tisochrysis_lutea.AAC.2
MPRLVITLIEHAACDELCRRPHLITTVAPALARLACRIHQRSVCSRLGSCSASLLIGYLRVLVQKVGGSANLVTACAVGFAQEILSFWCKTFGLGCW